MSSCRPSTQRPLPAAPATRRGRLDPAPQRVVASPVATANTGLTTLVITGVGTGVSIAKINTGEVGAP
jgi:hypothetical protein